MAINEKLKGRRGGAGRGQGRKKEMIDPKLLQVKIESVLLGRLDAECQAQQVPLKTDPGTTVPTSRAKLTAAALQAYLPPAVQGLAP